MSDRSDEVDGSNPQHGDEERTDVAIRDSILERVDARVEQSDFESTAHYVEFAMEEILARVEGDRAMGDVDATGDRETDGEVESRLESLGYM